jgi:hypothetical protein
MNPFLLLGDRATALLRAVFTEEEAFGAKKSRPAIQSLPLRPSSPLPPSELPEPSEPSEPLEPELSGPELSDPEDIPSEPLSVDAAVVIVGSPELLPPLLSLPLLLSLAEVAVLALPSSLLSETVLSSLPPGDADRLGPSSRPLECLKLRASCGAWAAAAGATATRRARVSAWGCATAGLCGIDA